jgi:NDP-sugar pyrophosphorylase family protein
MASLTDGDIRRYILKGVPLSNPAAEAANYSFQFLPETAGKAEIQSFFRKSTLNAVPCVDRNGKLINIFFRFDQIKIFSESINIPVVIMAGGKGTRLYPYTKILPKPLIPIGDITITEHIINNFIKFGCCNFIMIVNYKKEMIKAYFSETNMPGVSISYADEDNYLGTGGGLSLLRHKLSETFFFTNSDILILGDYGEIYAHHKESGNLLTMLCATKTFSFPYGTVGVDENGRTLFLQEKPSYSFLTNTGFYLIEPRFLDFVPENTFVHITDIIQNCIAKGEKIGVYPVSENQWLDMGNHDDMEKMRNRIGSLE